MTNIEKEFITYSIVTRGTMASLVKEDVTAKEFPGAKQTASGWVSFKSVMVRIQAWAMRKNPWGLKGPHLNPLRHFLPLTP